MGTWTRPESLDSIAARASADQHALTSAMIDLRLPMLDRRVRVLDAGFGEAILFVPMTGELNFVYAPQIAEFQNGFRVLAYEPCLSRATRLSPYDRACEIVALLDVKSINHAHVIAWSDVGAAAYEFALFWPDRCKSVVFLGLADRYVFPAALQFFVHLLDRTPIHYCLPDAILAHFLGYYLGGPSIRISDVAKRAMAIPQLTRLFKYSILPNLLDHQPQKCQVQCPCLVICGDRDRLVSVDQAHRMAALLPGPGRASIIPDGEHFLGYIHAEEVSRGIQVFYDGLM